MPTVRVGDLDIFYATAGAGEPVLLLQGQGFGQAGLIAKNPLFRALAARYRCVTLDNRGTGGTGKPDTPYSIGQMADDAAGLLDALGIGPAHVVGGSLGGFIAEELALDRPEKVKSLVLFSTGARLPPLTRLGQ
ncbi:MAG TPA: alpha/beta hydrolase, partial [Methanocella sp.]|nr:alpha/beta hydrolase [Methanocella sp.]